MKREARDADEVVRKFTRDGWEVTSKFGDRLTYLEKSGINITVVDGPMGTLIMPSGPARGKIFGKEVNLFSRTSTIGLGAKTSGGSENPERTVDKNVSESFI